MRGEEPTAPGELSRQDECEAEHPPSSYDPLTMRVVAPGSKRGSLHPDVVALGKGDRCFAPETPPGRIRPFTLEDR